MEPYKWNQIIVSCSPNWQVTFRISAFTLSHSCWGCQRNDGGPLLRTSANTMNAQHALGSFTFPRVFHKCVRFASRTHIYIRKDSRCTVQLPPYLGLLDTSDVLPGQAWAEQGLLRVLCVALEHLCLQLSAQWPGVARSTQGNKEQSEGSGLEASSTLVASSPNKPKMKKRVKNISVARQILRKTLKNKQ